MCCLVCAKKQTLSSCLALASCCLTISYPSTDLFFLTFKIALSLSEFKRFKTKLSPDYTLKMFMVFTFTSLYQALNWKRIIILKEVQVRDKQFKKESEDLQMRIRSNVWKLWFAIKEVVTSCQCLRNFWCSPSPSKKVGFSTLSHIPFLPFFSAALLCLHPRLAAHVLVSRITGLILNGRVVPPWSPQLLPWLNPIKVPETKHSAGYWFSWQAEGGWVVL